MRSLRQIGAIAVHRLRRLALDGAPIWLIGMPLVIIYVLGITMQGLFSEEWTPVKPFRVVVAAAEGADEAAQRVADQLARARHYFVVELADGKETARRSVLDRTADAALVVAAEEPVFTVIAAPGSVVSEALPSALRRLEREAAEAAERSAEGEKGASTVSEAGASSAATGGGDVSQSQGEPPAAVLQAPWEGVGAFEYFSAAMVVMFMAFASHSAMTYATRDRATGAYLRIRSLGISRGTYLASSVVSAALNGAAFALMMAVITRVLFRVQWGDPVAWSLLTLTGAMCIGALSFFVMAILPDNPKTVESAGGTIYTILAFFGGSTVPLTIMPGWFTRLFAWLPNRRMLDGYLAIAKGGGPADLAGEFAGLAAAALVLLALASIVIRAFKREGV